MINIMKRIKLVFFIFVLIINVAIAQAPQRDAVMMKMLGLKMALLKKDSVSLMKLLSDDVSYGHSNGWVQSKAQLIRDVMSGVQDYKSIEPANMNIRFYDNTVVVTMQSKIEMVMQGKPLNLSMNILLVWVFKNNEWKLVARQSVKNN